MPTWERIPIAVTLIVEVGSHRMQFQAADRATGCAGGTETRETPLEESIRGSVDTSIRDAHHQAMTFVAKAWANASPEADRG
jgi:hypothetical protein